jgi:energy-coupling factor transport system ATP-binding protein
VPDIGAAAAWRDVSVQYPYADRPAVGPLNLDLRCGERLLLLGPSGSGKSTLLGTLTGLVPRTIPATVTGHVALFGRPVAERAPAGWADSVAYLFQDADLTLCGMSVEDEIAFALENRGLPEHGIRERVAAAMHEVGLPDDWAGRRTMALSGGEKQLVAIAAALAQDAPIFVADEPTAHLSPAASSRLHRILTRRRAGRSALIVDHRLDGLIEAVDRVAVLDGKGQLLVEGGPGAVFRAHGPRFEAEGIWRPIASRLDAALAAAGVAPPAPVLDLGALGGWIDGLTGRDRQNAEDVAERFLYRQVAPDAPPGVVVARLESAGCAPYRGPEVLSGISAEVRAGELLGILGANGTGKSTLGAALAGLLPLRAGRRIGAPGGIAFQNPEAQFTAGSVRDEIATAIAGARGNLAATLEAWDLTDLADRHPFELSQGQKRRLALASLTASDRWPLLVLDEPTAGLDAGGAAMIEGHLRRLAARGRAIAVITHDMDFVLRLCPRAIVLGGGRLLAEGRTRDLMGDAALLEAAGLAPPAVTPLLFRRQAIPC